MGVDVFSGINLSLPDRAHHVEMCLATSGFHPMVFLLVLGCPFELCQPKKETPFLFSWKSCGHLSWGSFIFKQGCGLAKVLLSFGVMFAFPAAVWPLWSSQDGIKQIPLSTRQKVVARMVLGWEEVWPCLQRMFIHFPSRLMSWLAVFVSPKLVAEEAEKNQALAQSLPEFLVLGDGPFLWSSTKWSSTWIHLVSIKSLGRCLAHPLGR